MGFSIISGGTPTTFPGSGLIVGAHFVANNGATGPTAWLDSLSAATPCHYSVAMANQSAGQYSYWRGGTYDFDYSGSTYEIPVLQPANSGTLGNPITFLNYPGETPVFLGVCTPNFTANFTGGTFPLVGTLPAGAAAAWAPMVFGAFQRNYIIWDGFQAHLYDDLTVWGALPDDQKLASAFLPSSTYDTSGVFGYTNCNFCIVRNCEFIGVTHGNSSTGGNTAMVWITQSDNCEIYNNIMRNNAGGGAQNEAANTGTIWNFGGRFLTVRNNDMYDGANGFMQKDGPNESVYIHRNHVWNMTVHGLHITEQFVTSGETCLAYDNLIHDTNTAIFVEGTSSLNIARAYQIYNNTIVRCVTGVMLITDTIDCSIFNNIVKDSTGTNYRCRDGINLPLLSDYNSYHDTDNSYTFNINFATDYFSLASFFTGTGLEQNSINADPQFTVGTGIIPTNYTVGGGACLTGGQGGSLMGARDLSVVGVLQ